MAGSGDGERALLQFLDYPCTKRLRLRRLLAYHQRHTYEEVYNAYVLICLCSISVFPDHPFSRFIDLLADLIPQDE
jgi:hypothetical protein